VRCGWQGDLVGDPAADRPRMHPQPDLLGGLRLGERDHLHRFRGFQRRLQPLQGGDPVDPGGVGDQTILDVVAVPSARW
jgi:hypothetical protein